MAAKLPLTVKGFTPQGNQFHLGADGWQVMGRFLEAEEAAQSIHSILEQSPIDTLTAADSQLQITGLLVDVLGPRSRKRASTEAVAVVQQHPAVHLCKGKHGFLTVREGGFMVL